MTSVDEEWLQFLNASNPFKPTAAPAAATTASTMPKIVDRPPPTPLVISTKTRILHLNTQVVLDDVFWDLPIIEYGEMREGLIQKQMRVLSHSPDAFAQYEVKRNRVARYQEKIIKHVEHHQGSVVKYKDERKIIVGITRLMVLNIRRKAKNALYNCIALMLRYWHDNRYHEIHVKIFNTGKMEVPGVVHGAVIPTVQRMVREMLQPFYEFPIVVEDREPEANVLLNSNYNIGFHIQREALYHVLRSSPYFIECTYDPCSYPGVKCRFYIHNHEPLTREYQHGRILPEDKGLTMDQVDKSNKYTKVNVMFFRTGSCLIVGRFSDAVLYYVYEFIESMIDATYQLFWTPTPPDEEHFHEQVKPDIVKPVKLYRKQIGGTKGPT